MFRKIIKKAQEVTIKPLILWYLRKDRYFTFEGLKMKIVPGVFHPLLFHSTLILVNYLKKLDLRGKTFLEPGCGSGLVSLMAAKGGALVTALDINKLAVETTEFNSQTNHLKLNVLHSDLFNELQEQQFDFIFINPPYYPTNPKDEKEMAWFCGGNFEYFTNLFRQLPDYYGTSSQVVMILSEDCNLKRIKEIAFEFNQQMELLETNNSLLEKNYLFRVIKSVL